MVKTAVSMGAHRATGQSLFAAVGNPHHPIKTDYQEPADDNPSFTLGSGAYMSPMTMADAYATVAARGVYCKPIAIQSIVTQRRHASCRSSPPAATGSSPRPSPTPPTHILQGVITSGTAAGPSRAIGRPAAAKTGTGNAGDFAAFGGYTPQLAGYVSVFNPLNQITWGAMIGAHADYRDIGGGFGSGSGTQMFGDNAPGATWQITFLHADLGPVEDFVPVPLDQPVLLRGQRRQLAQAALEEARRQGAVATGPGPGGGGGPGPGGGGGGGGH